MTASLEMLPVLLAFLAGALGAWLLRERELGKLRADFAGAKERLASFERECAGTTQNLSGQFAGIAQGALESASRTFLELAAVKLGEERAHIKGALAPVQDEFVKFSAAIASLQQNSAHDLGALRQSMEQIVQLQTTLQEAVRTTNDTTGQLRNALQNPRVAGSWGELSLDRVVALGGMTEHCDFDRQTGMHSSDGSIEKPDLTIHLTGGLNIPVDAKASTANYIRSASESNEEERKRLLKQSVADLKARVAELRGRAYDRIDGYAGMTVLYVPNESMLSSALAIEPGLIEEALRYQIVICSPLLLLCYLRAFANGWRIQQQQENAEEVARRGRLLYERLQSFFLALAKVGKYLNHTVEKFNDVVAKTDNLLVPGREMGKLLALNGELQDADGIDTVAREVRIASRDTSAEVAGK